MTEPSNLRDAAEVYEEFAPIVEDSIYLAEHEAVMASIKIGGWLSAALDDPAVCDAMKADIERWFSAGFLYLDEVRGMIEADRAEVVAEIVAWLRGVSDPGATFQNRRLAYQLAAVNFADAIEAGEHLK